jgi:DNA invertase Pin-like site-specific DNA recombinase
MTSTDASAPVVYLDRRRDRDDSHREAAPRRAVIYTRLSAIKTRDKQAGNQDVNVAEQEAKLRGLASAIDAEIADRDVFTDNDLTAYKASRRYKGRPGFDAMLARLAAGDVGMILVYQAFRLYRSHSDLERLTGLCVEHKISVKTISGGDLDLSSATGQMVAEFLASVGKQEVALLAERAKDGKARLRDGGRWPGGRVPYGYRTSGDFTKGTGTVEVVEAEAVVIRQACADLIAGKSLHEIARGLDAAGVHRPGKPFPGRRRRADEICDRWDAGQVRQMVASPRYAALVAYKGRVEGEGEWPAIIDRATFDAVAAALESRLGNRKGQRGPRHRWLLSGIARCGKCASNDVRVGILANGRRGYTCRGCFGVTRDAERTDELVSAVVVRMLRNPSFAAALRPTSEVVRLNARRIEVNHELEEIAGARFTTRQKSIMSAPLLDELDQVEAKLAEAYRGTELESIAGVPDPADKWLAPPPPGGRGFTIEQKRALVRALVEVTVLPIKYVDGDGVTRMMGPPKGWKVGESWFHPESVRIEPRRPA